MKIIDVIFSKRKTINKTTFTSYALKHILESFKRPYNYISNGHTIVAMLMCGYKLSVDYSINCAFNVKLSKSVGKNMNLRHIDDETDGNFKKLMTMIYET
jgi:hypothetical protein